MMTIIIITKYDENDNGASATATDDSDSVTRTGRKIHRN